MFKTILENVRAKTPLVHCITNYVTVNDCANILLASGASPIMADDEDEVEDIISICSALDINIGTLNQRTIKSMIKAGKKANQLMKPAVLDPVGAGASGLRTDTTFRLLQEVKFSVIKGNVSEIRTIAHGSGNTKGVDADVNDAITEEGIDEAAEFARGLSESTGAVIAITGAIDIVSDKNRVYIIRNGSPLLSKITGSGCMLAALVAAYCGANPDNILDATAAAVSVMGLCGEIAQEKTKALNGGNATFRIQLIDAMYRMDYDTLNGGIKIEVR